MCSTERTNQMGYITVIARVARDLWRRKQTLSSGFALGLGSFTAMNPWHPCYNYNIHILYIIIYIIYTHTPLPVSRVFGAHSGSPPIINNIIYVHIYKSVSRCHERCSP